MPGSVCLSASNGAISRTVAPVARKNTAASSRGHNCSSDARNGPSTTTASEPSPAASSVAARLPAAGLYQATKLIRHVKRGLKGIEQWQSLWTQMAQSAAGLPRSARKPKE